MLSPCQVFERDLKYLKKKYSNIKRDIKLLIDTLKDNPFYGEAIPGLEGKVFKARLASSDMKRGKSKSYRVIYYFLRKGNSIYLLTK